MIACNVMSHKAHLVQYFLVHYLHLLKAKRIDIASLPDRNSVSPVTHCIYAGTLFDGGFLRCEESSGHLVMQTIDWKGLKNYCIRHFADKGYLEWI
jgi:hypothetical protein